MCIRSEVGRVGGDLDWRPCPRLSCSEKLDGVSVVISLCAKAVFSWLKKKAAQQSLFNVEINTRTLILVSNRADASIEETGIPDPGHTKKVVAAQGGLLTDIQLALDNGASLEDVRSRIDSAKSK
jgi:hypothetical protein